MGNGVRYLLTVLFCCFWVGEDLWARPKVSVYYPSPYGEYVELRTVSLVVGDRNAPDYIDANTVYAHEGVAYVKRAVVVGEYDGTGADVVPVITGAGSAKLRVLAGAEAMINAGNESLTYTDGGVLTIGPVSALSGDFQDVSMYVKKEANGQHPELEVGVGHFSLNPEFICYGGNISGVVVSDSGGTFRSGLGTNGTDIGGVWAESHGHRVGMWVIESNVGGRKNVIYSREALQIAVVSPTVNASAPLHVYASQTVFDPSNPQPSMSDPSGYGNKAVVYIASVDNSRSALYWLDANMNGIGYLGYRQGLSATELGSISGGSGENITLSPRGVPALGIDSSGRVVIGAVAFGTLNASLTITNKGSGQLLDVVGNPYHLRVFPSGMVVVGGTVSPRALLTLQGNYNGRVLSAGNGSFGMQVFSDGGMTIGNLGASGTRIVGGEKTKLDVNGYVVVKDIYITNPKKPGVQPDWASNMLNPVHIDYSNCTYTTDSTWGNCPTGYVAVGFDCTGKCSTKKMKLRCCKLK